MKRYAFCGTILAVVAAIGVAALPAAADVTLKPDDAVAFRQALMRVNSSYEGLLEAQEKGAVKLPANQVKQIGEAWLRMGKVLPTLFQKGTDGAAKTRAKPEIWSNADDFKAKIVAYTTATEKFQQAAQKPDDTAGIDAAFKEVNKACDDCHKGYRVPAQR